MPRSTTKSATRSKAKPSAKTTKTKPKATPKAKVKTAVKPTKSKKPVASEAPSIEQISTLAYEIWLRKGRPIGQDEQNWLEAERTLTLTQ